MELIKNNAKLGAQIAVSLSHKLNPAPQAASTHSAKRITIIGGASVDIIAQSDSISMDSGQSHVGTINIIEGGCSRNVAECVGRLGLSNDLTFISAVGDDEEKSEIIVRSLKNVGIVSNSYY